MRLTVPGPADVAWLLWAGCSPELAGRQYHWAETPLQLVVAPARAVLAPFVAARVVVIAGRRAGYVGRSPLSGNYEYFLRRWARGQGTGRRVIAEFLAHHRHGDAARAFFVSRGNDRSLRALLGALDDIGWVEGVDFEITEARFGRLVRVRPG